MPTKFTNNPQVKRLIALVSFVTLLMGAASSNAWEAYEFEVSHISAVAGSTGACVIGMKNLGVKQANDAAICDNPTRIRIENCSSEQAQTIIALAMIAKTSGGKAYHQAISQHSASPCTVKAYYFSLSDQ